MPIDLFRRISLDYLHPDFLERILETVARCRARKFEYFCTSAYRPPEEQLALWVKGRTRPGKIVTNAGPWLSAHQYGLACDFALDGDTERAGLQPDWRLEAYQCLREEAERLGLESGLSWKKFREGPHVQLPLEPARVSLVMLRGVSQRVYQKKDAKAALKSAWGLLKDAKVCERLPAMPPPTTSKPTM